MMWLIIYYDFSISYIDHSLLCANFSFDICKFLALPKHAHGYAEILKGYKNKNF